jgi:hypothetical protein
VTQQRAQKKAIRERMAKTGEKYTVARRAVVAGDGAAEDTLEVVDRLGGRLPTPQGSRRRFWRSQEEATPSSSGPPDRERRRWRSIAPRSSRTR